MHHDDYVSSWPWAKHHFDPVGRDYNSSVFNARRTRYPDTSSSLPSTSSAMGRDSLTPDIKALIGQTVSALQDLAPPSVEFDHSTRDAVVQAIDGINDDMRKLSMSIHDTPELAFKEFEAQKHLVAALVKLGFTVTNPSSLPTAFVATYTHKAGGRVFGFNAEFDALPEIGHACGHNLIAIVAVAAAAGLKAALKDQDLPGTVRVIGSPAEEAGGGKIILLNEGVYDGIDACVMAHPVGGRGEKFDGSANTNGPASLARGSLTVEFHGKGAHAGAAPWMGVNALDAAVQGYTAVSMLRQQLEPNRRVHGIIQGGDKWAPNVIPDYAKVVYGVRAPDVKSTRELRDKTVACFTAAAKATGCTYSVDVPETEVYAELRNNAPLSDAYADFMTEEFGQRIEKDGMTTASTDMGNVTYHLPAIHAMFQIKNEGGNHTKEFTKAAAEEDAHARAIKAAKGLAMVGAKFIQDDKFAHGVKKAFEDFKKGQDKPEAPKPARFHPAW